MDSRDSNVQQSHATLCKNGCGFYSNAGNEGLCSVCYKDIVKKKQAPPTSLPASFSESQLSISSSHYKFPPAGSPPASQSSMASLSIEEGAAALETGLPTVPVIPSLERGEEEVGASSQAGAASEEADREGDKEGKKKKNRCLSCKKKVGLTGFTCRCGGLFCSIHRYSDKHECNFDYKVTLTFKLD